MNTTDNTEKIDEDPAPAIDVDTSSDIDYLNLDDITKYNWKDIHDIRDDIAKDLETFLTEASKIIDNQALMSNIVKSKELSIKFQRTNVAMHTDIRNYLGDMEAILVTCKDKSGPIASLEDMSLYNHVGLRLNVLRAEITNLLGLPIFTLFNIANEAYELYGTKPIPTTDTVNDDKGKQP